MKTGASSTLPYDPAGRLYQTTGAPSSRFLYDGAEAIGEYNTLGTLLRRFVFGPGVDEPIAWYEGSGTAHRRWLIADERGSIIAVTDQSGAALNINAYDEYGRPASANVGRYQFTGQMWLPEAGVYSFKARNYTAALGRFAQTDPVLQAGGLNLYAYVANDPVNAVDFSGLQQTLPREDYLCKPGDICVHSHPVTEDHIDPVSAVSERGGISGRGGGAGRPATQQQEQQPQQQCGITYAGGGGSAAELLGLNAGGGTWYDRSTGAYGTYESIGIAVGEGGEVYGGGGAYSSFRAFTGWSVSGGWAFGGGLTPVGSLNYAGAGGGIFRSYGEYIGGALSYTFAQQTGQSAPAPGC